MSDKKNSRDKGGKRKALGKGLGALIPEAEEKSVAVELLPLELIAPNPSQPRRDFDDQALEQLRSSIEQNGVLQPIAVRPTGNGRYQIIAGERRFRAAGLAEIDRIPAVVRHADDDEVLELALIENLQREDLNPIEEAFAYQRLIDEVLLTQEEIAFKVSKNRSTVANSLRLLQLPELVQQMVSAGGLSAGHARALAGASSQDQLSLAKKVEARQLSVRETERLVKESREPVKKSRSRKIDPDIKSVEEEMTQNLGTRVRIDQRQGGKGRIQIEYYNRDQLDGLIRLLGQY